MDGGLGSGKGGWTNVGGDCELQSSLASLKSPLHDYSAQKGGFAAQRRNAGVCTASIPNYYLEELRSECKATGLSYIHRLRVRRAGCASIWCPFL